MGINTLSKKKESELLKIFQEDIFKMPDGEKLKQCIQCGTCSASCPTAAAMEYSPREIIAAFRAGVLSKVLKSNTIWICASCYSCTVRCPSGIKFTDVMYELKRLGIRYGMFPRQNTSHKLSKTFLGIVDRYGRMHEPELLLGYYLSTNPFGLMKVSSLGLKMFSRGRIALRPSKIKNMKGLRAIMEAMEDV